jgi:uncharacterized protein (UPF0332 family)
MVSATVDYHRERSRHFLSLVDDELTRGELEEASNKVWGAAAHAIKAVAERRGWQHHAHALLEEAVMRLIQEEGAPQHLFGQYMMASAYHQRFYGGAPPADGIRAGKEIIAEFIQTLETLG